MHVNIKIELHPLIVKTAPEIFISSEDLTVEYINLKKPMTIEREIECSTEGKHIFTIGFLNKNYDECSVNSDMAVIINSVKFQNLEHDFKIFSKYVPTYPEDWRASGRDCTEVIHSNYLGWNGTWSLEFETPIYRWIHHRLDLGWLI
jgi:hypothetical protein